MTNYDHNIPPTGLGLSLLGVHTLEIEDGTMIHMLAERRYPLSRELMIRMLEHGMEVEDESETAITLIHLFILWTTANGTKELTSPSVNATGKVSFKTFMLLKRQHVAEKNNLFEAIDQRFMKKCDVQDKRSSLKNSVSENTSLDDLAIRHFSSLVFSSPSLSLSLHDPPTNAL
ncbi:hypothetical protein Tco_0926210 [Tanacetum coccineum]|uniref:Uncharacterized protein n=1 Tax=Tanacetum coccineum TaxID=301880 RepID=A0ABQ5DC31_9ASTR